MAERVEYLDVAKLIGLTLVCFCHVPMPTGDFHIWVYSFHMPLFFLISGLFFKPERTGVWRPFKQLILPFIYFNIIAVILSIPVNLLTGAGFKLPSVNWEGLLYGGYPIGPSWFLISLFTIRVVLGWSIRKIGIVATCCTLLILLIIYRITDDWYYWRVLNINSSILGAPFLLIGYISRDLFFKHIHEKAWISVILICVSIAAIYNDQVGLYSGDYGKSMILYLIGALAGSLLIIKLCTYIHISKNVLQVYMDGAIFFICMHTLMFEYLLLFYRKITHYDDENTLVMKIVVTLLTLLISYPIILFLRKYGRALLGK